MSKFRFFKIGEEIKDFKGIEITDDFIIEIEKPMYTEDFEKHFDAFGKQITKMEEADEFIIFLSKRGIYANYMEYSNVMK